MNAKPHDLLLIGTFADATRLSLKALRLYDQLGILKPVYTDPQSGYRYYHASQFPAARLVRTMREMDMPLALIRQVMAAPPAEAEGLVRAAYAAMQRRFDRTRHLLPDLIHRIHTQGEITPMTYPVEVKSVPARPLLSVSKRVRVGELDATIGAALSLLYERAAALGAQVIDPPFGIYHGRIDENEDGPLQICVALDHPVTGTPEVEAGELPAGRVAAVILNGADCDFPRILAGYDAVADWIHQQGYEFAGDPREIWYSPPGATATMGIEWPFRER